MHCIGKPLETSVAFMLSASDCSQPTASGVPALAAVIPNAYAFVCVFSWTSVFVCSTSVLKCDYFLVLMMKEAIFSHTSLRFETLYALNCSDPSVRAPFVSSHHLVQTLAAFASSTTLKAVDVWDASVEKSARELWNTINQVETFQHLFCRHRST